jgi:hypothetical protein
VWDTEIDANEAAAAFRALFAKITGAPANAGEVARFVDPNGEVWRVEQRKNQVLCLIGTPAADGPIAEDAWKSLRPIPQ